MDCMYKSRQVGGGGLGGEDRWAARGGLYPLIGPFGVAMSPRSASRM